MFVYENFQVAMGQFAKFLLVVLRYFFGAMGTVIQYFLIAYMWIVIGRAVISWVDADPSNPIVRFLYEVTEPVLRRIRRLLPMSMGNIDFSPMVLILAIMFLQEFLVPILKYLGLG